MKFRVGQKARYVGPDYRNHPLTLMFGFNVPRRGPVYTIRECVEMIEGPGYLLAEIVNVPHVCPVNGLCEIAINEEYLRPVVERSTDISVFTEMLNTTKHKEPAR